MSLQLMVLSVSTHCNDNIFRHFSCLLGYNDCKLSWGADVIFQSGGQNLENSWHLKYQVPYPTTYIIWCEVWWVINSSLKFLGALNNSSLGLRNIHRKHEKVMLSVRVSYNFIDIWTRLDIIQHMSHRNSKWLFLQGAFENETVCVRLLHFAQRAFSYTLFISYSDRQ